MIIAIRSRYMSESPVWAANQGNLKEAASILRQSYNINAHVPQDALSQPAPVVNKTKWSNYLNLFRGVYLRRTTLATLLSVVSSFAYNAVAFGLPVIISSFFVQSMLTTILISLVLNLLFAFVGGLLAVRYVPRFGAGGCRWRVTPASWSRCWAGADWSSGRRHRRRACRGDAGAIPVRPGLRPGRAYHDVCLAELPDLAARRWRRLNQTLMRSSSTLSLFLFPLLVASLDTAVFWVIALAPFIGLASLLAIRWEPSGYDVDAEDYR